MTGADRGTGDKDGLAIEAHDDLQGTTTPLKMSSHFLLARFVAGRPIADYPHY
jgi:hypothetical protein